jgi:hypothetical protein
MQRLSGIILEGEKIGLEKFTGKDNKQVVNLHLLTGFESIRLSVRDANLAKSLEGVADRKAVKVKAEVSTYKDQLYLQALAVLS